MKWQPWKWAWTGLLCWQSHRKHHLQRLEMYWPVSTLLPLDSLRASYLTVLIGAFLFLSTIRWSALEGDLALWLEQLNGLNFSEKIRTIGKIENQFERGHECGKRSCFCSFSFVICAWLFTVPMVSHKWLERHAACATNSKVANALRTANWIMI